MNRREFLAIAASGTAATLAACADSPVSIPVSERIVIVVGDVPGLATTGRWVKVGPSHAVRRSGTSTFDAFSMWCTHQGCGTNLIGNPPNQEFACPCHGSLFNSDGTVARGPATKGLRVLTTTYNPGTDELTIN